MNTIVIDSTYDRLLIEEYSSWGRAQGNRCDIITLPVESHRVGSTVTYSQVPTPFLDVLANKGIPFFKT